ncbi:MAG: glutamate 5-kinase [Verrucomicrobiales bacterium]|jgi:glutamate 5-kinase
MIEQRKRIVVKFGSGILTNPDRVSLDDGQFRALTTAIAELKRDGNEVIIVSSGAVAAGLMAFGLEQRPTETVDLQACAAVGQSRLMQVYETQFQQHGLHVAQLLLTNEDVTSEHRRQNFENTLERLLRFKGVVPIINENDSVATEELKFGDNDALSARVAVIAKAQLLILLTSVDGIQTGDAENPIVQLVHSVAEVMCHVRDETGHFSVGGMQTKLKAVEIATDAGVETLIANGRRPEQLSELVAGGGICTRIQAKPLATI